MAQGDRGLLILEIDIAVEHVDRKSSPDSVPEERLAIGDPEKWAPVRVFPVLFLVLARVRAEFCSFARTRECAVVHL
jgi:hypothetical protein